MDKFDVGIKTIQNVHETIDALQTSSKNKDSDSVSNVIVSINRWIGSYQKYNKPGFFTRMLKSDMEIKINVSVSIYNIETLLHDGSKHCNRLMDHLSVLKYTGEKLKDLRNQLLNDINDIDDIDGVDADRKVRRINDLNSMILLIDNNMAQFALSIRNIEMIIDKFQSLHSVVMPLMKLNRKMGD